VHDLDALIVGSAPSTSTGPTKKRRNAADHANWIPFADALGCRDCSALPGSSSQWTGVSVRRRRVSMSADCGRSPDKRFSLLTHIGACDRNGDDAMTRARMLVPLRCQASPGDGCAIGDRTAGHVLLASLAAGTGLDPRR
jgi:hypothetical protein